MIWTVVNCVSEVYFSKYFRASILKLDNIAADLDNSSWLSIHDLADKVTLAFAEHDTVLYKKCKAHNNYDSILLILPFNFTFVCGLSS